MQLLDVAESAFGEIGFHETTMEVVAQRAEVTKPVLYDHFGSKENLLSAIVERAKLDLVETLTANLLTIAPDTHPKEVARTGVRVFLGFVVRREAAFRAYLQEDAMLRVGDAGPDAVRSDFAAKVADIMLMVPGTEQIPRATVLVHAEMVIAVAERAAAWLLRTDADIDEATELTTDFLWSGLRGQLPRGASA